MGNPLIRGAERTARGLAQAQLDNLTTAVKVIDYAHHEIHDGNSFTAQYTITTAATDGHRSGIYIKTPAAGGKLVHMTVSFAASTAATYSICEAPTIAANTGTDTSIIYNRYRDNTTTSGCLNNAAVPTANYITTLSQAEIFADATFATGTVLRTAPLTVGAGPKPAGGDSRDTEEYILKAGTAYVFLITNTAASANAHYIQLDWYEHTNKQ